MEKGRNTIVDWSNVYSADVIEFMSLSVRYCNTIEHINEEFIDNSLLNLQQILASLYQKALALAAHNITCDDDIENYITEAQYNYIREQVALRLGANDDYLDVFLEDMKYSDKPILRTISEDLADIYQPIGNFVAACQTENEDIMFCALYEVKNTFTEYWGGRALSAMRALHELLNKDIEES